MYVWQRSHSMPFINPWVNCFIPVPEFSHLTLNLLKVWILYRYSLFHGNFELQMSGFIRKYKEAFRFIHLRHHRVVVIKCICLCIVHLLMYCIFCTCIIKLMLRRYCVQFLTLITKINHLSPFVRSQQELFGTVHYRSPTLEPSI